MLTLLILLALGSWFFYQWRPKPKARWERRRKRVGKVLVPIYNWVISDIRATKKNYRDWRNREALELERKIADLEKRFYESSGE